MNPPNRRILLCAASFLCLYPGSVLAQHSVKSGANLTCTDVIHTKVVSALSIDEISDLGEALAVQNNIWGMSVQPFDDDERPIIGKKIEIGFLLARTSDLGGTPAGLIIWSERNISFTFEKSSESTIAVESSDLKNCHALATFSLSDKGYVLRDDKVVAQAR